MLRWRQRRKVRLLARDLQRPRKRVDPRHAELIRIAPSLHDECRGSADGQPECGRAQEGRRVEHEHQRGARAAGRPQVEPRPEGHLEDAGVGRGRHQAHEGREGAADGDADPEPHRVHDRADRDGAGRHDRRRHDVGGADRGRDHEAGGAPPLGRRAPAAAVRGDRGGEGRGAPVPRLGARRQGLHRPPAAAADRAGVAPHEDARRARRQVHRDGGRRRAVRAQAGRADRPAHGRDHAHAAQVGDGVAPRQGPRDGPRRPPPRHAEEALQGAHPHDEHRPRVPEVGGQLGLLLQLGRAAREDGRRRAQVRPAQFGRGGRAIREGGARNSGGRAPRPPPPPRASPLPPPPPGGSTTASTSSSR